MGGGAVAYRIAQWILSIASISIKPTRCRSSARPMEFGLLLHIANTAHVSKKRYLAFAAQDDYMSGTWSAATPWTGYSPLAAPKQCLASGARDASPLGLLSTSEQETVQQYLVSGAPDVSMCGHWSPVGFWHPEVGALLVPGLSKRTWHVSRHCL